MGFDLGSLFPGGPGGAANAGGGAVATGASAGPEASGWTNFSQGYMAGYDPKGYSARQALERELRLRESAAAEEAKVRGLQIREIEGRLADQAGVRGAYEKYGLTSQGLNAPIQAAVTSTYGMTPSQMSAPGSAEALRAKLASYDTPDSADFNAGARRPAMTAAELQVAPPTKRDMLAARQGIYAASHDVKGLESTEAEGKALDWTDMRKSLGKQWRDMPQEEKKAFVEEHSKGDLVRGFGSWQAVGKGGYLHYMADGKPSIKLTNDEAEELYALGHLKELDPERASKEIEGLKGKLHTVAKDMFHLGTEAANASNHASRFEHQDANEAARLGIEAKRWDREKHTPVGAQMGVRFSPNGDEIPVIQYLDFSANNGQGKVVSIDLPGGPGSGFSTPFNSEKAATHAEKMVGGPSGRKVNGKEVPYTFETAMDDLRSAWKQAAMGGKKNLVITPEELAATDRRLQSRMPPNRAGLPTSPASATNPDTGVEGLGPVALARIASDPSHPLRSAAAAAITDRKRGLSDYTSKMMNQDQFDPALYGQ